MFDNFTLIFGEPDSFDINPNSEEYGNSQQKVIPILSLNIEVYYGKIPSRVYWNLCQMGLQVCGRKRVYGFWKDGVFLGFPGFKWITCGCMGIYLSFLWKTMTGKSVHCLMSVWIYKNRYVFKKANSNPC